MAHRIALPARASTAHAEHVLAAARAVPDGCDVAVDCSDTETIGLAVLQILTALRTRLAARGNAARLVGARPELVANLDAIGFAAVLR